MCGRDDMLMFAMFVVWLLLLPFIALWSGVQYVASMFTGR